MRADSSIEKFYSKKVVFVATAKWVMNVVFAIVVFACDDLFKLAMPAIFEYSQSTLNSVRLLYCTLWYRSSW